MTPRQKALDYLISHARHGQRTRDLYLKQAFLELEIELTEMRAKGHGANGDSGPVAVNFARRDEDPSAGANGHS